MDDKIKRMAEELRLCAQGECNNCRYSDKKECYNDILRYAADLLEELANELTPACPADCKGAPAEVDATVQTIQRYEETIEQLRKELDELRGKMSKAEFDRDLYKSVNTAQSLQAKVLEGERNAYRELVHRMFAGPDPWEVEE